MITRACYSRVIAWFFLVRCPFNENMTPFCKHVEIKLLSVFCFNNLELFSFVVFFLTKVALFHHWGCDFAIYIYIYIYIYILLHLSLVFEIFYNILLPVVFSLKRTPQYPLRENGRIVTLIENWYMFSKQDRWLILRLYFKRKSIIFLLCQITL